MTVVTVITVVTVVTVVTVGTVATVVTVVTKKFPTKKSPKKTLFTKELFSPKKTCFTKITCLPKTFFYQTNFFFKLFLSFNKLVIKNFFPHFFFTNNFFCTKRFSFSLETQRKKKFEEKNPKT